MRKLVVACFAILLLVAFFFPPRILLAAESGTPMAKSISAAPSKPATEGALSRFFAPGPLNKAHAGLENSCLQCHSVGSGISDVKCVDCHKTIGKQREFSAGYHGLLTKRRCTECHADHKGREFDIAKLDPLKFNHRLTGFGLQGKHATTSCVACHQQKRAENLVRPGGVAYGGLQTSCTSCHQKDDPHGFKGAFAKGDCNSCHLSVASWKTNVKFDHDRDTNYALLGAHQKMRCASCHRSTQDPLGSIYRWDNLAQNTCLACHRDPHKEDLNPQFRGSKCTACHTNKNWDATHFDHDQSSFKLTGAHAKLVCQECHAPTAQPYERAKYPHAKVAFHLANLKENGCATCHDDYHKGQLGTKCESCHTDRTWSAPHFDHDLQSSFPLRGRHRDASCESCHKGDSTETAVFKGVTKPLPHFKSLSTNCVNCHSDIHKGEFGNKCQQCHGESGWKSTFDFHRNFTLGGVHKTLSCNECHQNNRHLAGNSQNCTVCHQKDDVHHGTLPKCSECHRQTVWDQTSFRHSLTRFPLHGAHRTLDCASCHSGGVYRGTAFRCVSCHLSEAAGAQAHPNPLAGFQDCNRCHNEFSFR